MWTFLGFVAFCSLIIPLEGTMKENPPKVLVVASQKTLSKYVSGVFLRNRLIQSYIQGIQFLPGSPLTQKYLSHQIQGLHIVKVYPPVISVELRENSSAQLYLKVRLYLSAQYHFSHLFERLDLIVDVYFTSPVRYQNYSEGIFHLNYESSETELTITQIICPSYFIKGQLKPLLLDILTATLPRELYRVVELVSHVSLYEFLYTANVFLSVHSSATIQYRLAALPQTTPTSLTVELNIFIRMAGRFLTIPNSDHPVTLPSLNGNDVCLVLTQDALNAILPVLVRIAPLEFITTPQVFSGSTQLIDAVAVLLSHQKCPMCPEKSPLKISLRVVEAATIVLHSSHAHFQLALEIAVAAKEPLGAITELFVLKASLRLNTEMSVHDNRLIFYTTLSNVKLLVISSDIGQISVTSLVQWIHLLLVELFMPHINECLNRGIPVPSLMHIKVDYPKFLILQGSLALCV